MLWTKKALIAVSIGMAGMLGAPEARADFLAGGTPAQDLTGTWELGAQLGGLLMDNQSNLEPHMLSGGRIGYYFQNEWEAEVDVLAGPITLQSVPEDHGHVIIPTFEVLYYGCTEGSFRPFVSAGAGVVNYDSVGNEDDTHFAMNLGGGAKWFVTNDVALRFDGRWLLNTEGGAELHEATLTGGLSWHFNPRSM